MRAAIVAAVLLAAGRVAPSEAQWHIGVGIGRDVYSGVSRGHVENGSSSFRPYRPLIWSLRIEVPGSHPRLSLDVRYSTPDIGLTGGDVTLIPHGSFLEMAGAAPTVAWTLLRLTSGVTIEGETGPIVERWRVQDVDDRTLIGAEGGLALRIELGGRFAARFSGRVAVTPESPLSGALIDGYAPRAGWRRGLEGTVLLRL